MKKIIITCDRCGKEIEGSPVHIIFTRISRDGDPTDDTIDLGIDVCDECVEDMAVHWVKEPEAVEEKKEPVQETKKKARKTWITKEDEEEIARRYRAGEDMLAIADDLNLIRPQVSRYITDSGLGKERYGNGKPPANGGAPIPTVMVGESLTGGSNWC